ncbi:MAG: DUF4935 domain-containing protein [Bacteroidales bacterium]|nr:DUF4935 domain-containing protein [Candidatus Colicola caccequi]
MKKHFPAYYRVHRDCLLKGLDKCLIVFDTNALLDIYRLPKDSANQVFDVLEHYKKQILIPNHTAKEYYKDIHKVLLTQIANIEKAQSALCDLMNMFSNRRNQPYISDRSNRHLTTLKNSITRDFNDQKKYLTDQLLYGEYQNKMADLLDGCVLDSFNEAEIEEIKREGEIRYNNHIPPGWKDADKGANRYGDLIIWKEILRLASSNKKSILYISNDQKEDWMIKEKGLTICPQYDLLEEFYKEVNDSNLWFHIYTLDRFLDFVNEKGSAKISEETVNQIRESISSNEMESANTLYDYIQSIQEIVTTPSYMRTLDTMKTVQDIYAQIKMSDNLYPFAAINTFNEVEDKIKMKTTLGNTMDTMNVLAENIAVPQKCETLGSDKAIVNAEDSKIDEKEKE